ncbi:hypothetical protein HI914_04462 [Erysiphe necator]|nr:hypothetical protein HI914_04462 [Erysiphe necator]
MANSFDNTALETINLLQGRLERIEYALCGDTDITFDTSSQTSIGERILVIEQKLKQLISEFKPLEELLNLYSTHQDLFNILWADSVPTDLDIISMKSIINASAILFSETTSRLNSVNDIPIPPPELSAQLIALQPQISKIEAIQANQLLEIKNLRERSALLVEKWYLTNVLESGEMWASLDRRARQIEQKIRQIRHAKQRDGVRQIKD